MSEEEIERHERLRNEVMKELVETEANYVEHLKVIVEVFMNPIKQKNLMNSETSAMIFSNINNIYAVNMELLGDLQKVRRGQPSTQNLGEIFLKMVKTEENNSSSMYFIKSL